MTNWFFVCFKLQRDLIALPFLRSMPVAQMLSVTFLQKLHHVAQPEVEFTFP